MAKLVVYRPKSLPHYLELVEKLQRKAGHPLWFRGVGMTAYRLLPSLYRHPEKASSLDLQNLEDKLMVRFRQRSIPYHSRDLSDDWEALFFMQHYGVPTRLLDWTENPFTGLHFALMSAPLEKSSNHETKYLSHCAVWIFDPIIWNKTSLKHLSYSGEPLTTRDESLKGYAPCLTPTETTTHPVALFGSHNSARIVAQQGVFTVFGTSRTPMEKLVKDGAFPSDALSRVVLPPGCIRPMRMSLLNQGITESTIFPDLDGLARETKRHFGFEA